MKVIMSVFFSVLLMPILVFGQGSVTLPEAGFTPASRWYFLDTLGEALQKFFTFNAEAKARLEVSFASERIAEIKILLETKGVQAQGLSVAEQKIQSHLTQAANVVEKERSKGKNVGELAKKLNEDFDASKAVLKNVFKEGKRALELKEKELKVQIRDAKQRGDVAQGAVLEQQLMNVKTQKDALKKKEGDQDDAFEDDEEKLEGVMEKKEGAQKAITEAERKKQEYVDEAARLGVMPSVDVFKQFDQHLAQAKELFAKQNYQGSMQQARQAKKSLENVDDELEKLKDEEEDAEEADKKEREVQKEIMEHEQELIKKQKESAAEENSAQGETKTFKVGGENFKFSQGEIRVKKGDKVKIEFANVGGWPHDWVIDEFNVRTPQIKVGESESVEFIADKTGTFEYYCSVGQHRQNGMKGVLIVE